MAKMRKKSDLPTKICVTCGRPFTWRKAWARVWDEVRYCSDRCRKEKGRPDQSVTPPKA
ncbi:MAG: DUF2256 domain-containing protein [Hyphomicrobium sp.]|jgi:hypothetical protein